MEHSNIIEFVPICKTSRDEHVLGRKMAPMKKILRRFECFIALILAGSLLYVMLRRNPESLPQEQVVFKQIVKTGKMLFNLFMSKLLFI